MSETTFSTLATEMSHVFEPLASGMTSATQVQELLASLGWQLPPGVSDIGLIGLDITALTTASRALARSTDAEWDNELLIIERVANVMAEIAKVKERITAVMDALTANPALPADYLAATGMAKELLPRLLDYLVVTYLERYHHALYQLLKLTGIVQREAMPADAATYRTAHDRVTINVDIIGALLSPDRPWASEVYGWGNVDADIPGLIENAGGVLTALGATPVTSQLSRPLEEAIAGRPVPEADTSPMPLLALTLLQGMAPDTYRGGLLLFQMRPSAPTAPDAGLGLMPFLTGTKELTFPLPTSSRRWTVVIDATVDLGNGVVLTWRPNTSVRVQADVFGGGGGNPMASGRLSLAFQYTVPAPNSVTILTFPGGTSFTLQGMKITGGVQLDATGSIDAFGEAALRGGKLTLSLAKADGLVGSLCSASSFVVNASPVLTYSQTRGLTLGGSGGLEAVIAINESIGPLRIDRLHVALGVGPPGVVFEASVDASVKLGPLAVSLQRIGADLGLDFKGGNLGPLDLANAFKSPTGFGLLVDAQAVSGGGFLSREVGPPARYAGALALKLTTFGVNAFGVFERTPTGAIALAMVLGIRFFPGLQLGFGFALTGVGGLVGINRRADVDALKERLVSGAAGNVLFAEDPIRNAPTLLGDLVALFPAADGIYVIGPTLQIGWLLLARFDLGIIIELPGPTRVILLGVARLQLGGENGLPPLIQIRLDILGIIDFPKQFVSFDAALVNSRLLQIFHLTGDAAFRLSTGERPYVLLSIGGFHPAFSPEPLVLPQLTRVALTYDTGGSVRLWLRLEAYLALTSNTFQVGAALEAGVEAGPINAMGFLGFDALIQFKPFYFTVNFAAGFRVRWKGVTLAGVTLSGTLSGPGPLVLAGSFSFQVLFVTVTWHDTFTLGEEVTALAEAVASVILALTPELERASNLRSTDADDLEVLIAPRRTGAAAVVMPQGLLTWAQRRAPLNILLERLDGVPLTESQAVVVTATGVTGSTQDWVSPGTYLNLSESEALNRTPFDWVDTGVTVGFGLRQSASLPLNVDEKIKTIRLFEEASVQQPLELFPSLLLDALIERVGAGRVLPAAPRVGIRDETWAVRRGGAHFADNLRETDAHQRARTHNGTALPTGDAADPIQLGAL
jgi:hypothetical protein